MEFEIETTEHEAAVPAVAKRTAEDWATDKGMLPEFTEGRKHPGAPAASPSPLVHNPSFASFARAKTSLQWPIGMELTEAEFDKAIADADGHVYR